MNSAGSYELRPRARLLHTLGSELISNERVALVELVKNAYDADARRVLIKLSGPLTTGSGMIEVLDDGHGMSSSTIRDTWMEMATPHRTRSRRSLELKRPVLGEKGIGRFAAARLADRMTLVTRAKGSSNEVRLEADWAAFRDPDKYLDEIELQWSEGPASSFAHGGQVAELWDRLEEAPSKYGTYLRMVDLTSEWRKEDVYALRRDLSRLVNPSDTRRTDAFEVMLDLESVPSEMLSLAGTVLPPAGLTRAPYRLKGAVGADAVANLEILIADNSESVVLDLAKVLPQSFADNESPFGPIEIDVRVWDRDSESMRSQAGPGSSGRQFSQILNEASGVNIYRDGFRVLPYGESGDDWLSLDKRRINNPSLRLSNNQIIGEIFITSEDNPELRDQTNREGLIASPAYDALVLAVREMLNQLEQRRWRHRRDRQQSRARPVKNLFEGIDLQELTVLIKQRYPGDRELAAAVSSKQEELDSGVARVKEVVSRYSRLATLGRLVDDITHQGQHAIGLMRNKANKLEALAGGDASAEAVESELRALEEQLDVLASLFRRIAPFGGRRRGRPKEVVLEDVIRDVLAIFEDRARSLNVSMTIQDSHTVVSLDPVEVQDVVVNLVDNALYWLSQGPPDGREIDISVSRSASREVAVTVSDSGPGVPEEIQDLIFDPYFSAKEGGTGLGLAIAGELLADHYDGSLELLESELGGATFRALFRKRV